MEKVTDEAADEVAEKAKNGTETGKTGKNSRRVLRMVDHVDDNRLWSPAECLRELADGIEAGKISSDGVIVHVLSRCPEHHHEIVDVESWVSQVDCYEQLYVLERAKELLLGHC